MKRNPFEFESITESVMSEPTLAPKAGNATEKALTIRVHDGDNVAIVVNARGLPAGTALAERLWRIGSNRQTGAGGERTSGIPRASEITRLALKQRGSARLKTTGK